ncbi:UPF0481 protein At3g47200-like [Coffea eugenioides]|uniref:UPF0481 protein At3g47200-like n=1 Tax=Coffea eugenioides TaxID=49369 RepID=UPI000F6046C8|nr:UPF0481 protein At3g47200-like [Coffea eugenioides]
MLLESQLPFFILRKLYETLELPNQNGGLIRLALNFFSDLLPVQMSTRENENPLVGIRQLLDENENPLEDIRHLLDLIHRFWSTSKLEAQNDVNRSTEEFDLICCSTQLAEARMKLEKFNRKDIFDIQFNNGSLQIPTLVIEDRTESFIRNLIAYEQYRGGDQINIVTDYVTFLGCLIKSEKDVTQLSRHGIIRNLVGEHEVISQMLNKLNVCTIGPSRNFHYAEIFGRLNIHCNHGSKSRSRCGPFHIGFGISVAISWYWLRSFAYRCGFYLRILAYFKVSVLVVELLPLNLILSCLCTSGTGCGIA